MASARAAMSSATSPATSRRRRPATTSTRRCAANANAFARAEQVVAVIGPYSSFCAQLEIPILNRAPGGPLALVSPIEQRPEPDARDRRSCRRGPQGRAGPLLPHGHAQLRSGHRPRRRRGRRARAARAAAAARARLPARRAREDAERLLDRIRSAARPRGSASGSPASEDFGIDAHEYAALAGRVAALGLPTVVIGWAATRRGGRWSRRCARGSGRAFAIMVGRRVRVRPRPARSRRARGPRRLPGDDGDRCPTPARLTPAAARFAARFGTASHRGYAMKTAAGGGGRPAGDRALRRHARVGPAVSLRSLHVTRRHPRQLHVRPLRATSRPRG